MGALMTSLLLVMLFTEPMNEIPPALNATGVEVGADVCVAAGGTCVADVVVVVVPVVGCPVLPPVPAQAVIKSIKTRTTAHTSIP